MKLIVLHCIVGIPDPLDAMKVDGWFSREDAIRAVDESKARWREERG